MYINLYKIKKHDRDFNKQIQADGQAKLLSISPIGMLSDGQAK